MDGKVLSSSTKKKIVKMIVDLSNVMFLLKPIVNGVATAAINWLDGKGDAAIPDKIDKHLDAGISAVFDGDYDLASLELATASNMVTDLPNMDENEEQKLFTSAIGTIISLAEYWMTKKWKQ